MDTIFHSCLGNCAYDEGWVEDLSLALTNNLFCLTDLSIACMLICVVNIFIV